MKFLLSIFAFLCVFVLTAEETQPFRWSITPAGDGFVLTATVAPGHYFYANDSFRIATGAELEKPPAPQEIDDEFFGKTKIYPEGSHEWRYKGREPYQATVEFQGCRKGTSGEPALCFLPETVTLGGQTAQAETGNSKKLGIDLLLYQFRVERKALGVMNAAEFKEFLAPTGNAPAAGGMFAGTGVWLVLLLTLLGGIGLNLTPCVLPMIPVNLAIIGADGTDRATGFRRGLFYGAGMAAAYGTLGVVVILTGARFGELNSSSVFNFVIAGVFLLLSLAMFGIFNLDFSGKLHISPKKLSGSKSIIAFVMGAVAALLAGACVAPVVIGVLLFSAELYNGGNYFALFLPFLLGIGMALPWPAAGAGFAVLPKPGKFMVIIKNTFGVIIVLAALYYAYTGYTLLPGKFSAAAEMSKLATALSRAEKPVLIDFWATWCKNCKEMEKNVFSAPEVKKELERYEVVKFQAERLDSPEVKKLLDYYEIKGLPAFVILKKQP